MRACRSAAGSSDAPSGGTASAAMTWTVIWRNAADSCDRRAWSISNRARATSVPRHMRLSVAISGVESLSMPMDASPTSLTARLSIRVTKAGAEFVLSSSDPISGAVAVPASASVDRPSSSATSAMSDGLAASSVAWGSSAMVVAVASSLTPSLTEALSAASKASIMAVKLSSIMISAGVVTVSTLAETLPLSASSTTTKLTFSSLVERMVRSTGVSASCAKTREVGPNKQADPTSR